MKNVLKNLIPAITLGALSIYAAYTGRGCFAVGGEWMLLGALITAAVAMWKGEKNDRAREGAAKAN